MGTWSDYMYAYCVCGHHRCDHLNGVGRCLHQGCDCQEFTPPMPRFRKIIERIRGSRWDDGYIVDQIIADVQNIGDEDVALSYVQRFSPSKLGRLGFPGLRKLAMIKKGDPGFFEKLTS